MPSSDNHNGAPWRERAPKATRAQWHKQYDAFFDKALKNNPSWWKWKRVGEIHLTPGQQSLYELLRRSRGTVLDVGCGPGFLVGALLSQGVDAYGCDCSHHAVKFALDASGGMGKGRFFHADIYDPDLTNQQYDTVVCAQLLEHLPKVDEALLRLWELVKPGGQLYIQVPAVGPDNEEHLHSFSESDMGSMAQLIAAFEPGEWPHKLSLIPGEGDRKSWQMVISKREVELKWCMLNGTSGETSQANEIAGDGRIKTGMFNWLRLWQGVAIDYRKLTNPDHFDVIHIQLSGTNFSAPSMVRQMLGPNSKTRIVVNLDYALEYWYMFPPQPELFMQQLAAADHLMAVEPYSARALSSLTGRQVPIIPHPADTTAIKKCRVPVTGRHGAMVMFHRDNQQVLPYWILRDSGLDTRVIGLMQRVAQPDGSAIDFQPMLYDYVHEGYLGGEEVIRAMASSYLMFDSYTHRVCGRSAIEAAALGVPCIGYPNVWAQRRCFPDLTVNTADVSTARRLVRRLLDDEGFYRSTAERAMETVEYFNYDAARERYLAMLGGKPDGDAGQSVGEEAEAVRPDVGSEVAQPPEPVPGDAEDQPLRLPA